MSKLLVTNPTISIENNERIAKNTLMLYFRMILTMLVSLYTSRVVLNTLGIEDYGTYNVVGGIVTMFGFFNGAMISATQRFLSFQIGRKDFALLRRTFNVSVVIHTSIALLIFILAETIGLWFVNQYLNIPESGMEAARWVYHFSVLAFMVTIIQVPYNAIIIAHERMSVYAYMSILEVILKLIIVFMLTWIAFDKLKLYGILLFGVSLIVAFIYRRYSLKKFNDIRFELVKDKVLYKTLLSYSSWNLFGNFAIVAKGQGVSIILNIFFGTIVNAAHGIANQVYSAVNSFVSNFQMASNPQIIKTYAAEDSEYMVNLVIRTSKLSFYLLFILSLPVILEIDYILNIWLKLVPEYTSIFTVLILINALIDCISGPLMTTIQATGRIKIYQCTVGTLQILILPISYYFFKKGFHPETTFIVSIIVSLLALATRLIFIKRQIAEFPINIFANETFKRIMPVVLLSVTLPWLIRINMVAGPFRLIFVTTISIISSIGFIYMIGLGSAERRFFKNAVLKYINIINSNFK